MPRHLWPARPPPFTEMRYNGKYASVKYCLRANVAGAIAHILNAM